MTHNIKLLSEFCDDVYTGKKTFEIRYNDRDYKVGDKVRFTPISTQGEIVKHPIKDRVYEITYILSNSTWGLQEGYIVFSIKEIGGE